MKKCLFIAICVLALVSCKEEPKAPVVDMVQVEANDSLQKIIDQRDAEINEMIATLNEIQEGFRLINEAERRATLAKEGEGADRVTQIKSDIKFIQDKMASNKKLIEQLRLQLNESSFKGEELKKTIDGLVSQLESKDKQLAEKDIQIARLTALLQNAQEQQAALVQTLAAEQALAAADKKQLLLQAGATEQQENPNPPENVKVGFFRKIFGK